MNVQVIQLAPISILMLRHRGPYEEISPVFDQLWSWIGRHGVPARRSIGIYWDNPDYVAASKLRSAACAEIPAGYRVEDAEGLPLEVGEIAAGEYATTRYTGPYEELTPVWSEFTQHIEGRLRRRISDDIPAFELYLNDPSDTPSDRLVTELYMPLL